MRESLFEGGRLEIMRYLPPALLEGIELNALDIDCYLSLLARARYVEELESSVLAQAISLAIHGR